MRIDESMIGVPIYTQEGSHTGKVKEVRGRFFKVDAPFQPDYWLRDDHVASATPSDVRLAFAEDRINDHKLGDPEDYEREHVDMGSAEGESGTMTDRGMSERALPNASMYGQEGDVRPMRAPQPIIGWADVVIEYRQIWQDRYGSSGDRWEDFEPGYRYGHEMADDPRYRGREWADIEPELRQNYGDWSRGYGYRYDENEWNRIREHAREAMNRGRMRHAA